MNAGLWRPAHGNCSVCIALFLKQKASRKLAVLHGEWGCSRCLVLQVISQSNERLPHWALGNAPLTRCRGRRAGRDPSSRMAPEMAWRTQCFQSADLPEVFEDMDAAVSGRSLHFIWRPEHQSPQHSLSGFQSRAVMLRRKQGPLPGATGIWLEVPRVRRRQD